MNKQLLYWSITCALAGFIFGFDLVVISGAEQKIEALWGLTAEQHGWAISAALWGTVLGSIFGGFPTDRLGRKKTLLSIGLLYLVSAIGSCLAPSFLPFFISRFIGGIGIGISTVAAPLFIAEISPASQRGRLTGMFQFNIVLGLLIATLSNFAISHILGERDENSWRWMLGVEAIPALIYSLMCFTLPESPRWLISKGRRDEGKKILSLINPDFDEQALEEKICEIEGAAKATHSKRSFSWSRLKLPITLAFLLAFFNQLSGINAILGFAPRIFGLTGIDTNASLFNSTLITLVNLIFTMVGLWLIDRLGRRTLLYVGSFGYIISLGICAWAFHTYAAPFSQAADALELKNNASEIAQDVSLIPEQFSAKFTHGSPTVEEVKSIAGETIKHAQNSSGMGGTLVLVCILAFIAAHAIGQGAVIWVFIAEIFPTRARGLGQSFGSATHWVFAALLTLYFPKAMETFEPSTIFGFFCIMMFLQLIWVKLMVPETKGISLEQMEEKMTSR